MKKLFLLCATLLTGCSLMIGPYDANEYFLVTQIRTVAEAANCNNPIFTANTFELLYVDAAELKNYSQYLPNNDAEIKLTSDLFRIVEELHNKENPSVAYCKAKLNIIAKSAERIQQVTGSKPR
jgi:hypothetical protein